MNWLIFALAAAGSFGFYNFFAKLAADRIAPALGLMGIAGTSFLVAGIYAIFSRAGGAELVFSKTGLIFAVGAGLATGVAELFYLLAFPKGRRSGSAERWSSRARFRSPSF